ncbi:hypothetical protein OCH239_22060 [Roseivivax halodurans JCM 10272]|uniref:DUF3445 domain-containing protein n=1 Tax=Roseivivax halodurans JCM 10272 TaxID=1449350 RepID=X7EHL0_9RHOB|nr:DUF3445 domain-containing protein [Roseivivax halodurans]ETX14691.1 hypothetical protein OCH239_22060 [Roseivivax halodurans JCM 10272]
MILQRSIPYDPSARPRLPGIAPLDPDAWIMTDDAFAAQMAERERLLHNVPEAVLGEIEGAKPAVAEALGVILDALPQGYIRSAGVVTRPDGVSVTLDADNPLVTVGRLVQEDVCILTKPEDGEEHVLAAAVLCFPARWRLAEKLGRPLISIHEPVPDYDDRIAPRVQRLFDGIGVGRPLWRCNELWTSNPTLHRPDPPTSRPKWNEDPLYLRSERQCLVRLPQTRAIVFTIHTWMLAAADAPCVKGMAPDRSEE